MDHIDRDAELSVLDSYKQRRDRSAKLATVTREQVLAARHQIDSDVAISPAVKTALVDISRALREDDRVLQGNSTRSMVLMLPALQVSAALRGRDYVSPRTSVATSRPSSELAPGVADTGKVLGDCMREPMDILARSTLMLRQRVIADGWRRCLLAAFCAVLYLTLTGPAHGQDQDNSGQGLDGIQLPEGRMPLCFGFSDIRNPRALAVCDALNLNENVKARELSEQWVRTQPDNPAAQFALAEVLFTVEGNLPRALFHLQRAEQLTGYNSLD
ncbi:MAG: hypothetical protein ACE37N_13075, partial [Pseudohongiellaceae bacterium]